MSWLDAFRESNLEKGKGRASFFSVLLQAEDKQLLESAALELGVKPSILAARIVTQVLRRHRLHIEAGARE